MADRSDTREAQKAVEDLRKRYARRDPGRGRTPDDSSVGFLLGRVAALEAERAKLVELSDGLIKEAEANRAELATAQEIQREWAGEAGKMQAKASDLEAERATAIDYLDNILDGRCADSASVMRMIVDARAALVSGEDA